MKPTSLVAVLVFLVPCFLGSVQAQTHDKKDEIPIERCDRLPVVTMKVAGENRRFLLETAATSAREVFLPQVELGTHKLLDLKLPAIDLSPIGKACEETLSAREPDP